jgi:translation initiation factor 3 subunit A
MIHCSFPNSANVFSPPGLLENFYSRQAKVYMMANNQLFHAAALHKLFVLRKEQKKTLTKDEATT